MSAAGLGRGGKGGGDANSPSGGEKRLALCLAQEGSFRRISAYSDEPKITLAPVLENTGKSNKNSAISRPNAVAGEVPERLNGLVSKTSVPSPQPPTAASTCENPENKLGALLGAPENTPADPDLAAVLTAWEDLPDALKAGIAAMVKTASGNERSG